MVRACFIGVRCWKKLFYLCDVSNETVLISVICLNGTVLISVTGLDELFLSVWQTESNRLLCALLQELSLFYAGGYIISFMCGSLDLSALEGANRSHASESVCRQGTRSHCSAAASWCAAGVYPVGHFLLWDFVWHSVDHCIFVSLATSSVIAVLYVPCHLESGTRSARRSLLSGHDLLLAERFQFTFLAVLDSGWSLSTAGGIIFQSHLLHWSCHFLAWFRFRQWCIACSWRSFLKKGVNLFWMHRRQLTMWPIWQAPMFSGIW